ncbi:TPA: translational GTPase TypA [Candidatus Dependentiae bacterium]|nr:MAG: Translation-regulating membrane GTPase TypA [candidate division TM6 bacterium GW2011_GWF2_33_332]HBS48108.1 translational GTPase TypA [Candidatus Dependentiae bacterium]HBZ73532.1 translational GTPase TypA [Candidatus Dependentiae bacterium]
MNKQRKDLRNIAIIAHVDHGKTTLVDEMLKQSGTFIPNAESGSRVMDSGDIEKERGITILAKNTSVYLPNSKTRINIVDTPGHMDFGGEVERTLQMVEGFLLLVDAAEGPLPGTRFVLQKALQLNLKPIVLINKIDRKDADVPRIEAKIHDLFLELAHDTSHLDFPILYGSSKLGFASSDPNATSGTLTPLFDAILEHIPAPVEKADSLQLLITNLDHSDYLGRIGIGKILSGTITLGSQIICCKDGYVSKPTRVLKLYQFEGINRKEVNEATFGDIVAIAGVEEELTIGTTICLPEKPLPVPYVEIDKPTLSIYVSVNSSPFAGREGNLLTSRQIRERLQKELKTNVALQVEDTSTPETFKVSGRGQLHLGILIETMRREGFEVEVSAPEVIMHTMGGQKQEPMEHLTVDIEEQHQGEIIKNLGMRKAIMLQLENIGNGRIQLEFKIPARGLIGFRSQFIMDTRGTGLMGHRFAGYAPYMGEISGRNKGSLISMDNGSTTGYALNTLQERGVLFVTTGVEVYEGMIVGEHSRDNDLEVNPTKKKKLTNMRATGTDDAVLLAPPRIITLENALDWINDDELIEITPKAIRLRKKFRKAFERKKNN